jgi:mannose-6-phosphate isomerase-like protein (cupin superfamily)
MDITKIKSTYNTKPEQLEYVAVKEWGHEEWIANNELYCGKKLVLHAGYQCSMHHHKIKDETFYVQSGKILLEMDLNGSYSRRIMTAGDVQRITPGMWHRFSAIQETEFFEFSTFHQEEDSYRRTVSGKVNWEELGIDPTKE